MDPDLAVVELAPGDRLGDLVVGDVIGRGGLATVHRAAGPDGRRAALKVLRDLSADQRRRIERELRIQERVDHPNVVRVEGLREIRGAPVLVMELVDGPTLDVFVARNRPLPIEAIVTLGAGIVAGLRAVHALGVVHRDLKPSNVLLARTAAGLVPKVADFGLVKVVDPRALGPASRTDRAFGTPRYMAPEQFTAPQEVDPRADLFALGALLYEVAAGAPAFSGRTIFDVYFRIAAGEFVGLDRVRADLPRSLVDTIHRCLRPEREERTADCDAFSATWSPDAVGPPRALQGTFDLGITVPEGDSTAGPAHLDLERLGARDLDDGEASHVARCVRCRTDRRRLARFLAGP